MLTRIAACTAATVALVAAPASAEAAATLNPPKGLTPGAGATVEAAPSFTWNRVAGAEQYEFQVAADSRFGSVVEYGSFRTRNTAASLRTTLADSKYYWRVRAIAAEGDAGRWTAPRSFTKAWTTAPQLLQPSDELSIQWPTAPLVLRWTQVPHATKYGVLIATDPGLSNTVIGTLRKPLETQGTTFALPGSLAPGRYYWAVTPINQGNFRGTPSRVGSFVWNWSSGPETQGLDPNTGGPQVFDLNPSRTPERNTPQLVHDPLLTWDRIPGTAKYEVEVNPTPEHTVGSRVFAGASAGPAIAPSVHLPNNTYYWRFRAVDQDGNAGPWIDGPMFRREFAHVTQANAASEPTVQGVRIRDNVSANLGPVPTTSAPLFTWEPVRGASQYELQFALYSSTPSGGYCDWAGHIGDGESPTKRSAFTPNNAWAPGPVSMSERKPGVMYPGSLDWAKSTESRNPFSHVNDQPGAERKWCARVLAWDSGNNTSEWTYVNGEGRPTNPNLPAFTFKEPPHADGSQPPRAMDPTGKDADPLNDLHELATDQPFADGYYTPRTPYFTWDSVPGAASYWIVVARDEEFTNVIDVAFTRAPVYAPRIDYTDEGANSYYWAVMPAGRYTPRLLPNGTRDTWAADPPTRGSGRAFIKQSHPPILLSLNSTVRNTLMVEQKLNRGGDPGASAALDAFDKAQELDVNTVEDVPHNPVFRWKGTPWRPDRPSQWPDLPPNSWKQNFNGQADRWQVAPVESAATYTLQVASDPTFRNLVEEVKTAATSHTSTIAYPADSVLYWRVRANLRSGIGLNWSRTGRFTRGYPAPVPYGNPSEGEMIPELKWHPVPGAVSYDIHVLQSDGKPVTFSGSRSSSFTPILFYGLGVWQWKVRAVFPGKVAGPWSAPQNYVRRLNPPQAVKVDVGRDRMRFTWNPDQAGYHYRLDISDSDSFSKIIDTVITPTTSFAPQLSKLGYRKGGQLYWRLAVVDEGRNVGGFTSGRVALPKAMLVSARAALRVRRRGAVTVTVKDANGRAIRAALVQATGAGARAVKLRTNKKGTGTLRVRPTKRGTMTVKVVRKGYRDAVAKVTVR